MNVNMVNPFIDATTNTFSTMCAVAPSMRGKPFLKEKGFIENNDIVASIGLTGSVKGAVLITMETATAQKVVGAFIMEEITEVNDDLMDGMAEIINIIAGAAGAKLKELNVELALPTVMIGKDNKMYSQQSAPWVIIPMKFPEWGEFNLEVSMENK